MTVTTAIASKATIAISANMPIVVAAYAGARMPVLTGTVPGSGALVSSCSVIVTIDEARSSTGLEIKPS
ncbi:hypothetical protein GCM10009843_24660 [Nocardioides bigeumensis]|uniref:Uncharacterized protein n=1 Tax=Nocardioides bigeumensis TaxID=433657 RepID=A0ABN2YF87_9ACTN